MRVVVVAAADAAAADAAAAAAAAVARQSFSRMGRQSKRQALSLTQLDQLIPTLADLFDTERVHSALKHVVTGVRERRNAILHTQNGALVICRLSPSLSFSRARC